MEFNAHVKNGSCVQFYSLNKIEFRFLQIRRRKEKMFSALTRIRNKASTRSSITYTVGWGGIASSVCQYCGDIHNQKMWIVGYSSMYDRTPVSIASCMEPACQLQLEHDRCVYKLTDTRRVRGELRLPDHTHIHPAIQALLTCIGTGPVKVRRSDGSVEEDWTSTGFFITLDGGATWVVKMRKPGSGMERLTLLSDFLEGSATSLPGFSEKILADAVAAMNVEACLTEEDHRAAKAAATKTYEEFMAAVAALVNVQRRLSAPYGRGLHGRTRGSLRMQAKRLEWKLLAA
jgi:hypothetical protein